jgi:hypothetical protein
MDDRPDPLGGVPQHAGTALARGATSGVAPTNDRALGPSGGYACLCVHPPAGRAGADKADGATPGGSLPLIALALTTYLTTSADQRRDHTDTALNDARTEAHDELLWQLTLAGRECERSEAVNVAREILNDPTKKTGDKTLNTRQDWETTVAIHCQNAVRYLKLLELDATKVRIYETAYKTEDIRRWAKTHARAQIEKANEKANGRATAVHSVAAAWCAALHEMGLSGIVKTVGITKTESGAQLDSVPAQTYIDAEAAWWSSLVRAPYNSRKGDDHAELDTKSHQAFLAFGAGIAVARCVIKENQ